MQCPCGSGLSFLSCCKEYLSKYGDGDTELYDEKDFNVAEKIWRGKLTQYLGWVFRDTLPMLKQFPGKQFEDWIQMDIDALDEIVYRLTFYLDKQNKQDEITGLFDHLTDTVALPNIEERMLFWKALWYDCKLKKVDNARKLLQDISVEKVTDVPLLTLYIQLCGFELSICQRFEIIDKILKGTEERSQLLQYNTLKAINLIMIGEIGKAHKVIEKAIHAYEPLPKDESDIYYLNMFARALATRWGLAREKSDLDKALEYYEKIPKEQLTTEGKAKVHEEQAALYKNAARYKEAIYHYEKTIEAVVSESAIIHLAEVYIKCNQIEKGKALLAGLKEDSISDICMLEYLQIKGLLGLAEKDEDLVRQVVKKVKTLKVDNLYFQDVCNQLCIELLEMLNNINQKGETVGFSRKLAMFFEKFRLACQYLELKPNLFGVGFNFNKIIGPPKNSQNLPVRDRTEGIRGKIED
ncbi:MAG: hypothetical protein KAJ52_03900 [Sedimentisphaerales bacterium]|nr:hypothetical protein [Sedimentisphaerales bacterium]